MNCTTKAEIKDPTSENRACSTKKGNTRLDFSVADDALLILDKLAENHFKTEIKSHENYLSKLGKIVDYVCGKVNLIDEPSYKEYTVSGHQQRFNMPKVKQEVRKFITELTNSLPSREGQLKSFEDLFELVSDCKKDFIGGTAIYDFCLRYSWNEKKDIIPEERVYLHSKPVKSAVMLIELIPEFPKLRENKVKGSYYIPFKELPDLFVKNGLGSKDVEHMFCCNMKDILRVYNYKTSQNKKEKDIRVLKKHILR